MRKTLTTLLFATSCLLLTNTANAQSSQGYKTNLASLPTASVKIDVQLSEDMQVRAEGLSDDRRTCINSRRSNNGFACNGFYGQRDLDYLTENLEKWTTSALLKKDVNVSDDAGTVLKITLIDARNNRPTINQLRHDTSLSFQSFALGGADIEAELFDASGKSLGTVSYAYYDSFFDQFTQANGTWTDARHAMKRFSVRVAKDIASNSLTGA